MPHAARVALDYRRSEIRVLFDAAAGTEGALRLEVGEPSFVTPQHIIDAALEAARNGHTGYGPNGGLLSLRELLSVKLERVNRIDAGIDDIVVTPGGMNALYSAFTLLLEPGDEVLLPTPGFPNMDEMVRLLGGVPRFYRLLPANGFLPDFDELASLVTPKTKVMFVNSPSNPTGRVYGEGVVREVVEFANRHDLWLISDEVYDELVLDPSVSHVPSAWFDTEGRVISVFSFSKVYAMTGWRVGYAVARGDIPQLMRSTQEPQVSCPSTISQKAAEAALTGHANRSSPCATPTPSAPGWRSRPPKRPGCGRTRRRAPSTCCSTWATTGVTAGSTSRSICSASSGSRSPRAACSVRAARG